MGRVISALGDGRVDSPQRDTVAQVAGLCSGRGALGCIPPPPPGGLHLPPALTAPEPQRPPTPLAVHSGFLP